MSIILLGLGIWSRCSPTKLPVNEKKPLMIEIFAKADWYLERPEPEMEWRGLLQERDVPVSPTSRAGVRYLLITKDKQFPVYAANVEQQFATFVGHSVIVRGKLVDLSNEGYGQELWIASIRQVEPNSR